MEGNRGRTRMMETGERGGKGGMQRKENNSTPIDQGEVDTSDAALVAINGRELKEKSFNHHLILVEYCSSFRRKTGLELFTHCGFGDVDGGLISHEGEELEKNGTPYYHVANFAINELNSLRKDMKLRLVKLFKVNTVFGLGFHRYMTFSAVDELSGNTGVYQAAVVPLLRGKQVLGLFRDHSNDKILAILSVTGDEEDLTANKKAYENDSQCYRKPVTLDYRIQLSKCRELKNFTALGLDSGNSGSAMGLKVLLV